jgi:hypothetical protein
MARAMSVKQLSLFFWTLERLLDRVLPVRRALLNRFLPVRGAC